MGWRTAASLLLAALTLTACLGGRAPGTLSPTLEMIDVDGVPVAFQGGAAVPDFGWQPRPRIDLVGPWRGARVDLDADLTMADRDTSLAAIESEADGRQLPAYDDAGWSSYEVPGTFNPPPDGDEGGAWYRRTFDVPADWAGRAVSVRFASANYVVDVWLNGAWIGYHEGGATPFAFDVGAVVAPGQENLLAVRVHAIPVGSRTDVVPWGLVDWWNYGGLTGDVWLEASPAAHVARADVRPYLDAVDLRVVIDHPAALAGRRGTPAVDEREEPIALVRATVLPATVTDANVLDPDPRTLVPPGADALVELETEVGVPKPGSAAATTLAFTFTDADLWSPERPALYVLRVDLAWSDRPMDAREARPTDTYWTTFGIRHVAVDPIQPRVLLNGEAAFFRGVGLHDEQISVDADGVLVGGTPDPGDETILERLRVARAIGADLVRTGHQPADRTTLMLADRLGLAVWEEIPLYHATPAIFERTMPRGIPQQMLREMALRDMNRPSVLFHGLANESTGQEDRADALAELHAVDREIDGTRLTGQAAYGWQPDDPTQAPLDVAGYTFYHGVFYGAEPGPETRQALREAHEAFPDKPILVLEFGRWADTPADAARQLRIFEETYAALERHRSDEPGGFVSAASWWTLHDFATQLPGIGVEDFGLFRPDGTRRPAGDAAAMVWETDAPAASPEAIEPDLERPLAVPSTAMSDWSLLLYLVYALVIALGAIAVALGLLTRRGGRSVAGGR
jgi:beta-glucuronidase